MFTNLEYNYKEIEYEVYTPNYGKGKKMLNHLVLNPSVVLGLILIAIIAGCALFAPVITQYDPYTQLIWVKGKAAQLLPPCKSHWFGTDIYGRDIFSRVVYGARISLQITAASVLISTTIGIILGGLAGYFEGLVDDIITFVINVFLAFPFLLFVLALVAYLPSNIVLIYLSIGAVTWVPMARLVRGKVLACKQKDFVKAARALGASDIRIILKHIFPNILNSVIVMATIKAGDVVLMESALSFLGFGIQPPEPSWGLMIKQGHQYLLAGKWWWALFPGLGVMMLVLGFNLVGDGLRDALDPRLYNQRKVGLWIKRSWKLKA